MKVKCLVKLVEYQWKKEDVVDFKHILLINQMNQWIGQQTKPL